MRSTVGARAPAQSAPQRSPRGPQASYFFRAAEGHLLELCVPLALLTAAEHEEGRAPGGGDEGHCARKGHVPAGAGRRGRRMPALPALRRGAGPSGAGVALLLRHRRHSRRGPPRGEGVPAVPEAREQRQEHRREQRQEHPREHRWEQPHPATPKPLPRRDRARGDTTAGRACGGHGEARRHRLRVATASSAPGSSSAPLRNASGSQSGAARSPSGPPPGRSSCDDGQLGRLPSRPASRARARELP